MRSPEVMNIIEIDITNACVHSCANCTRMCGHHKETFFMGYDTFVKAVDSLEEWEGCVGIIGGEPTLHPEFERFMDYLRYKRIGDRVEVNREPIFDMQIHDIANLYTPHGNKAILFSSMSNGFYRHFETISDTFPAQGINDHQNLCEHQALLISRKEIGISDEEWITKRDACWIQNNWSATITPKGAFFCEVAGALDMLFHGPGGWPIEKGWYKRQPKDFTDQLHWCELCSGCLDVPKRISSEECDDVSPQIYEKLKKIRSPKALSGKCVIRNPKDYEKYKEQTYTRSLEYIERGDNIRISKNNRTLYPKDVLFFETLENFANHIQVKKMTDWIAICANENKNIVKKIMQEYILNPGCLYILDDEIYIFNVLARSVRDKMKWPGLLRHDVKKYYPDDKIIGLNSHIVNEKGLRRYIRFKVDDPDDFIERNALIVYGARMVGTEVIKLLHQHGIKNFYVAVTKKEGKEDILGHRIYEIDELKQLKDNSVVIVAAIPFYHKEITDYLRELGFHEYRFLK